MFGLTTNLDSDLSITIGLFLLYIGVLVASGVSSCSFIEGLVVSFYYSSSYLLNTPGKFSLFSDTDRMSWLTSGDMI